MKELGSSNGMTDGKNVQGRPAQETRKTRGDATTEQTPRESGPILRKKVHFTANGVFHSSEEKSAFMQSPSDQAATTAQPSPASGGVWQKMAYYAKEGAKIAESALFYTTLATAVADSTIRPVSAKGLSNNDRYGLSMGDDYGTQLNQRGRSHYQLESRRGSSSVDSPSGYMGKGHDEFPLMVRIGDYEFVKPTGEDIKALLQDKDFPKYLGMACRDPRGFTDLLKNDAFLDMISPMYQDKNVQNFMFSLCKNPGLQADFLKLKKEVSNTLIERRMDALFKRMDALLDQFGDDGYDKKRETDHLPIQKNQRYQGDETILMQMMHSMQELMQKMLDQQHEKDKMQYKKDKMRISQDEREKERLFDSRERERQHTRKMEGQSSLLLLAGTVILVAYVCKCTNKPETAEEMQRMPQQRYTEEYWEMREFENRQMQYYRREEQHRKNRSSGDHDGINTIKHKIDHMQNYRQIEQGQEQSLRYRKREGKQPQIEFKPEDRLKIEEIKGEESKTESSYGQEKREYSEQDMMKRYRANLEILNDKELLLKLFKQDKNEYIKNLFYDCGSKNVVKKILDLDRDKDKKFIFQNKQFQKSLLKSKSVLGYLYDNKRALEKVKKYGGEELEKKVSEAIFERKIGEI